MPTVILLDVSLSMCRPSSKPTSSARDTNPAQDVLEIRQLANIGIGALLDYLAQNSQFEYTSLVVFSSLWEIRSQFTRDHETIKNNLYELELYDKSNIVNAIRGTLSLKLEEWSQNGIINIILVTDGQLHPRHTCNDETESDKRTKDEFGDITVGELAGLFDFPCKIQIVCLTSPRDPALKQSLKFFNNLIEVVSGCSKIEHAVITPANMSATNMRSDSSAIWLPESNTLNVSAQSVENLFTSLAELHYKPYHSTLSFGHLSSKVVLSPKPRKASVFAEENEFDESKGKDGLSRVGNCFLTVKDSFPTFNLGDEITICGFMPSSKTANPAVISRHHVYPVPDPKYNKTVEAEQILTPDNNPCSKSSPACGIIAPPVYDKKVSVTPAHESGKQGAKSAVSTGETSHQQDITKQPSFCVLLHNSLRQENMVAICIVGKSEETNEDWYGILHSYLDSRKRSSLMLSILLGGKNTILWLPNFRSLGSVALADVGANSVILDKPARYSGSSKSYSSNSVIWLDPESVQADVQKIARHAKRAPDKAPHFYKELNRIRRAAISYGFYDVLSGLALILERERRIMTSDIHKPANPEVLMHIDHVIHSLRADLTEYSYDTSIVPPVR